LFQVSLVNFLK